MDVGVRGHANRLNKYATGLIMCYTNHSLAVQQPLLPFVLSSLFGSCVRGTNRLRHVATSKTQALKSQVSRVLVRCP